MSEMINWIVAEDAKAAGCVRGDDWYQFEFDDGTPWRVYTPEGLRKIAA